jgi:competence protein ComGC
MFIIIRTVILLLLILPRISNAEVQTFKHTQTAQAISAEGSCAVVEMTAEQCQLLALQRARASAIEQASGIAVTSSTLVTNGALAVDFIKTYSKGFIINEKVEWLPLGQYQKDKSTAPIPEYTVKIVADVYSPDKKIKPLGLNAKLNSIIFKSGDKAGIGIKTTRKARIAVFNITGDDKVVMLFPNDYEKDNIIIENAMFKFPADNSKTELIMQTLPGHKRDAEAFFIIAMDADYVKDFMDVFTFNNPMSLSAFFRKYADISDFCEDVVLTYEVVAHN